MDNSSKTNNASVYSSQTYHKSLLQCLNEQRISGEFCDVEVVVEKTRIKAHKSVLSASSPYFRAMFTTELKEKGQTSIEIHLLSGAIFKSLIDFIYSGNIEITSQNVQELLIAADMLEIKEVVDLCTKFLKREIDVTNALGIFRFAEGRPYGDLTETAEKYIYTNFTRVFKEDEFVALPKHLLEYFLRSEMLRVDSEYQVFLAALRWINHDVSSRRRFVFELLQHIRLPLLSMSKLEEAIHSCSDHSLKVALRSVRKDLIAKKGCFGPQTVQPRLCAKKDIFVIGGSRREPVCSWTRSPECITYKTIMRFDTFKRKMSKRRREKIKVEKIAEVLSEISSDSGEESS